MHVWLKEEFINKTRVKALEKAIEQDTESEHQLLYEEVPNEEIMEFEITETGISIGISNDLGYFNVEVPLDLDDFIQLLEIGTKKFNKLKAVFEGLK